MIPKKSLDSVLDKSIILTKTAPNDNAKSISVQCAPGGAFQNLGGRTPHTRLTSTKMFTNLKVNLKVRKKISVTANLLRYQLSLST